MLVSPTRIGRLASLAVIAAAVLGIIVQGLANPPLAGAVTVRANTLAALASGSARPPASSASSARMPIGLSYGDTLPALDAAALAQTLDDAAALGATWIRVDLAWSDIQPQSPSQFEWAAFDRIVAAAGARGITVLPALVQSPAWARPQGCRTDKCAPANPGQFAAFAAAAATRYTPAGVRTWEIWNEPNVRSFWQPAPDAAQYVALLRATAAAMRSVDPGVRLISGGLAPAPSAHGDISQLGYLSSLCRQGGLQLVDAVGYHPYSFPVPPGYNASWNAWAQIAGTETSFRSIMAACGAAQKKLWLTEYGAPTNGPGAGATVSNYRFSQSPDHVDEALQATMATDSIRLARSSPEVAAVFWYTGRDQGTDRRDAENFYGLRRFDGTPKPAYNALRVAIAAARG